MVISRKISSSSTLTIPNQMRVKLGWETGISFDMEVTESGTLLIKPHVNRCRFCGAIENIKKYKDLCICSKCGKEIKEVL